MYTLNNRMHDLQLIFMTIFSVLFNVILNTNHIMGSKADFEEVGISP